MAIYCIQKMNHKLGNMNIEQLSMEKTYLYLYLGLGVLLKKGWDLFRFWGVMSRLNQV